MASSTNTLAEGCFGKVYKQKYGDAWAAMKKVPKNFITEKQLSRECLVYEKAQHRNVVRLLGTPWLEAGKWHIPLEFIFGEDLETAIFKEQKSKLQLIRLVKATLIVGMCEGLYFLHSKDIVHQDLKPDNIMIEHGSHRAVIIDMGLAKFFKNGFSSAENLGNEAYAAPEIFNNNIRDKRSDVWAMGKIIAELCVRVRLHTRNVTPSKIKDTLKGNPYCSVVCKMVAENTAERASMSDVIGKIRRIWCGQPPLQEQLEEHGAGAERPHPGVAGPVGLSSRPQAVVPFQPIALANELFQMSIPCQLPADGKVVHRRFDHDAGLAEIKQIVMRGGQVVQYEDLKITK